MAQRIVTLHGDWHLWLLCCDWRVLQKGKFVGDSQTDRRILRAAEALEGQSLIDVSVEAAHRRCSFSFDLGGMLETAPYDADSEQWLLFEPSGMVLTYRADGLCSHHPGSTPIRDIENWVSISAASEEASI